MVISLKFRIDNGREIIRFIILSMFVHGTSFQSYKTIHYSKNSLEKEDCPGSNEVKNMDTSLAVVLYKEENVLPLHKHERSFNYCGRNILIKQDWSGLGVAAVVWDAAEILAEYLEGRPEIVKDKAVIELGAGTGLVGIVAALLGAKTTITDREEVLGYLETMVKDNLPADIYKHTKVLPLDWTKDLHNFPSTYDVILGADIVYIEDVFDDLLKTMMYLSNEKTVILLSCRIRYDRDTNFLKRLEEHFEVTRVMYSKEKDVNLYSMTKR